MPNIEDVKLIDYLNEIESKITCVQKEEIIHIFKELIDYYLNRGKSINEIKSLLRFDSLNDFYVSDNTTRLNLDNAGLIYPLSSDDEISMYRLSATLKEKINPLILQAALVFTIKRIPIFSSKIKKDFFWHYLEMKNNVIKVQEEKSICENSDINGDLYRVLYRDNRISLELFHGLTDAGGALVFLKTLVAKYLRLLGVDSSLTSGVLNVQEEIKEEELLNAYKEERGERNNKLLLSLPSLHIDGTVLKVDAVDICQFEIDSNKLKSIASSYGGTVTAYILSIMFIASRDAMSKLDGKLNIQVPVNMRKYKNESTLRNYSMYFGVSLDMNEEMSIEKLVKQIDKQIKEKGSEKEMNKMISSSNRFISLSNHIPLFIKKPLVSLAYKRFSGKAYGNNLSNLGVIEVPEELKKEIIGFDFVFKPEAQNKIVSSLVTYNGKTKFSIIKRIKEETYENKIFELLNIDELEVKRIFVK